MPILYFNSQGIQQCETALGFNDFRNIFVVTVKCCIVQIFFLILIDWYVIINFCSKRLTKRPICLHHRFACDYRKSHTHDMSRSFVDDVRAHSTFAVSWSSATTQHCIHDDQINACAVRWSSAITQLCIHDDQINACALRWSSAITQHCIHDDQSNACAIRCSIALTYTASYSLIFK